jgi:hypothetical protein
VTQSSTQQRRPHLGEYTFFVQQGEDAGSPGAPLEQVQAGGVVLELYILPLDALLPVSLLFQLEEVSALHSIMVVLLMWLQYITF